MRKPIIGVMGAGRDATPRDVEMAAELGRLIAKEGWILLSGGRNTGVMDAVNKGAQKAGGLTIGILPRNDPNAISEGVDIPIITDMGSARNNINVLSSDVVIACGTLSPGTLSEVALGFNQDKKVILIDADEITRSFIQRAGGNLAFFADDPEQAVEIAKKILKE